MIDSGTGLTILGSAIGGAKIVEKILGPTSEYIGEQLKEWTKKKIENTSNIFKNAEKKLGNKINIDGKVPPKVLRGILENGAWSEEDLQIEYFGGALASSRTGISRDDRGAYFVSLIGRLTTYQLRTHYLFYHLVKKHFNGQDINIHDGNNWRNLEIFLSFDTFYHAMDFCNEEEKDWGNILSHAVWGLYKEDLITGFSWGNKEHIQKKFKLADKDGILFQPTKSGVELLMWAYGLGQESINNFFNKNVILKNDQTVKIGKSIATKDELKIE